MEHVEHVADVIEVELRALPEDERPWSFEFTIESAEDERVVARFPVGMNRENGTGFFRVTVTSLAGSASAVIYLFPGETGPEGPPGESPLSCEGRACSLDEDLTIAGDLAATNGYFGGELAVGGEAHLGYVDTVDLFVTTRVTFPDCPPGYELDETRPDIVLCRRPLGRDRYDEVVRVGDIWVDRYEASVWSTEDCSGRQYGGERDDWHRVAESFPYHGQFIEPLYACSVTGAIPSRWITWFQARDAHEN